MEPAISRKLSESLERISAKVEKIQSQQAREEEQAEQITAAIERLAVIIERLEPHLVKSSKADVELKERKAGQTIATIIYGARVTGQIITIVAASLQLIQDSITKTLTENNKAGISSDSLVTSHNLTELPQPLNQIILEMAQKIGEYKPVPDKADAGPDASSNTPPGKNENPSRTGEKPVQQ
jgi:HSP90 family molecular chaperone